jgi:uncharacterized protein YodC (DUF2158 family)
MTITPDTFVIGLTVYLKSGSPEMTVRGIGVAPDGSTDLKGLIQCVWVVDGRVMSGDFPAACLQMAFPGSQGLLTQLVSPHHV